MKNSAGIWAVGLGLALVPGPLGATTHGDRLIGAGAASSALGGVDAAVAPDAAGAVSNNPATLAFLTEKEQGRVVLTGAVLMPVFEGRAGGVTATSEKIYALPTLALAGPGGEGAERLSYGFGAYVVSGLGGDYRGSALDTTLAPTPFPRLATARAELQVVELAAAASWRFSEQWSLGLAATLDHGGFNLGEGERNAIGAGGRLGVVYRPSGGTALGLVYEPGTRMRYSRLVDFDNDGAADALRLESPEQVKAGVSREFFPRLRLAAEARWFGWSEASGYGDFGWRDAWLLGAAAEYVAIPGRVTLRAAYNFGESPVRSGRFDGTGTPGNTVEVQGKAVPAYYYEAFRVISFAAAAEQHFALGAGCELGAGWRLDAALSYSPASTVEASGTDLLGRPVVFSTRLTEFGCALGFSCRY